MDFQDMKCEDVDWIRLAQNWIQWEGHLNTVMPTPVLVK
jgi:hypothetical protein